MRGWAQKFGLGRAVCVLLLVALVGLRIWDPWPLEELRLRTFDTYQIIAPRVITTRPAVIIDIDEDSLSSYGQWPWPRTRVAELVTRLTELGALAIAFDIIFAEPDRLSPAAFVRTVVNLDDDTRLKLGRLPSNDQVLADAMRQSRVVLGQSGTHLAVPAPQDKLPVTGIGLFGADPTPYLVTFPGLLRNIPVLEEAAAGRGLLSIRSDADGIVRRLPMVMAAQNVIAPSLTLELLRVVTGAGAVLIKTDAAGVRSVGIPGLELPTDRNGQLWIHFSRHDPGRYVSAKDVLEGRVGRDRIERRLALIGTSAVGLLDVQHTPVEGVMPGVEIHAQILESALSKSVLSHPNRVIAIELINTVLIGIAAMGFAPVLAASTVLALGGMVAIGLVGLSWYAYSSASILLDFTFPLLASFSVYLCLVFVNYYREQTQRRRIRSAFGQYLAPSLVEQLAQSREKLVLGGEVRAMTIMFSDVRGFTAISELYKDDPHGLTLLMNRLLTPLTNAILDHHGTIDKYMGDAIMAFWNAPIYDASQELNACGAALEMIDRVNRLNGERELEAIATGGEFLPLRVGIGLNSGRCVVGNFGSDLRFNYSVLGDPVNLASRLEAQTKYYGVPIIIGSQTAERAKEKFAILELDLITVKGKSQPEAIYALLGREGLASDRLFQDLCLHGSLMLRCYRERDWTGAAEMLGRCRAAEARFGLKAFLDLYWSRIEACKKSEPPSNWAGVFVAQVK
jgi:adenylate cyclase